jgi:putative flippase GtrA
MKADALEDDRPTTDAGPGALASFARFVLLGGGVGLASSGAVPLMATVMPWVVANALVTIASTGLGTELHARFTFGAGQRARWHQHVQSAGSAVVAYLVTSVAVLVLHAVQPAAGMRWEQAVYLGASALAGTGRFLVLRLYVFALGSRRTPGTPRRRSRDRRGAGRLGRVAGAGVASTDPVMWLNLRSCPRAPSFPASSTSCAS